MASPHVDKYCSRGSRLSIGSLSRLALKRFEAGLRQSDLAKIVGVHREQISRIERGHSHPSLATALALAEALSCDVTELFPVYKLGSSRHSQSPTKQAVITGCEEA